VYGLSYAQQLKNKDIPGKYIIFISSIMQLCACTEGGAKAVVLVDSEKVNPLSRGYAIRKAVKAFTDSLLVWNLESLVALRS
jgi:glutamate dehydrogenase